MKNTENLCFMILDSDVKFEEKLTLGCKNDIKNLVNSPNHSKNSPNHSKVQKSHFNGLFLSKSYEVELKNTEELSFMTMNSDA